jgi:hypothetical protein
MRLKTLVQRIFMLCLIGNYSFSANCQIDSTKAKLVKSLITHLKGNYVSLELATQMGGSIQQKFNSNGYDSSLNMDEFTYEITRDLRRICNEHHINVQPQHFPSIYTYTFKRETGAKNWNKSNRIQKRAIKKHRKYLHKLKRRTKKDMYIYGEIKILPGNIGYVEIKEFRSTQYDKALNKDRIKLSSVMRFLKGVKSLVIDLRNNVGGSVEKTATFCSYFSPTAHNYFITTNNISRAIDLNDSIWFVDSFQKKHFTPNKTISGFAHCPVDLLISARTFSSGELAAYKIKQYNISTTIIGEKTIGGCYGYQNDINMELFNATIPNIKCYDESNHNETDCTGIVPDVPIYEDSAFTWSYKHLLKGGSIHNETTRFYKKKTQVDTLNEQGLVSNANDFIGNYGKAVIVVKNEKLYMLYDQLKRSQLRPTINDSFTDGDITIRFARNANKTVIAIKLQYNDGYEATFRKRAFL